MHELNRVPNGSYETFRKGIENPNPEISANVMIGLIRVASYMLDRQLAKLESDFLKEGGLRENMTLARIKQRNKGHK